MQVSPHTALQTIWPSGYGMLTSAGASVTRLPCWCTAGLPERRDWQPLHSGASRDVAQPIRSSCSPSPWDGLSPSPTTTGAPPPRPTAQPPVSAGRRFPRSRCLPQS